MKKITTLLLALFLFGVGCPFQTTAYAQTREVLGISSCYHAQDDICLTYDIDAQTGTLTVSAGGSPNDFYLRLFKNDAMYGYRLSPDTAATIPLNMGDGEYRMELLIYIQPNRGERIWQTTFTLTLENSLAPFLSASRIVNWTPDMALAEKAQSLTAGKEPKAAALALCDYIAKNYTYNQSDTALPATYLPDLKFVFEEKQGICYDFAALYAAMCRSAGIPCRLVMGYSEYTGKNVYHAWCEVYIGEQWLVVDPTYSLEKGACFLDSAKMTALKYY